MKLLTRRKLPIPAHLVTKALQRNFTANQELFKKVLGTVGNNYLINPVSIVCPICVKQIALSDTGLLLDYIKHLKVAVKTNSDHREFLACLKQGSPYSGPRRPFDGTAMSSRLTQDA